VVVGAEAVVDGVRPQVAGTNAAVGLDAVADYGGHVSYLLGQKSEIRISKSETNPKFEFSNTKQIRNRPAFAFRLCLGFRFSCFEFVSDFEIRISDFNRSDFTIRT
jgi:hypothetical protein